MHAKNIALVVIGRNEARHLEISLPAIQGLFERIIYVDSGSIDNSREIAQQNNAEVIALDTNIPFTAARARNAGFDILRNGPKIHYVQFIDGDCELIPEYLGEATNWLDIHPEYGMVCGRRRERYPERTIFNMLCNLEWNTPAGETKYCGGDVTVRYDAIKQVGGYNPDMIAGEDPEICVRLRQAGWKIYRIDADMTWHDANIIHLTQWWRRHRRTGHAYAEGAYLHGRPPEKHCVRESRRNWLWGGFAIISLFASLSVSPLSLILLLVFPLQALRIAINLPYPKNELPLRTRIYYGLDCSFSKIPEFIGQLRFTLNRITRSKQSLIEYK